MKYRWGFIDENDAFTECFPIVEDSTSIDYAQQSGEIFYRAKMNGELAFRFEFQDILDKGYNYEHHVVLQWYDADNDSWGEIWRGRFSLTDCTIDYDSNTITVTPDTIDRYTKILDDFDKEYNIVKLAPAMQPVDILIRPLLQVYISGDSKISNYVGNNYWEAECTPISGQEAYDSPFGYKTEYIAFTIKWAENAYSGTPFAYRGGKSISYVGEVTYAGGFVKDQTRVYGQYWDGAQFQTDTLKILIGTMSTEFLFQVFGYPEMSIDDQYRLCTATYMAYGFGFAPTSVEINLPALIDEALSEWDLVCARVLVQTDLNSIEIQGTTYALTDILPNDIIGTNLNYNKWLYAPLAQYYLTSEWQEEPTMWGKNYNDKYFVKPSDSLGVRWIPVGQSMWRYFSIWYRITNVAMMETINDELTANRTIADSYRLDQATIKLLRKAGWTGTYWISRALNGNNDYVGESSFVPVITAKSNVISSYYNSPAQNAPLSLAKIFAMLKQAYRIYWYIDDNGNIHVEHISYYDNGYSYTESSPTILIDLESEIHTNTKEHKAYGQNKVTFDKENMPAQFTFGWADEQTVPFNGYPIDCLDQYVNKGTQEQNNIGSFDTDVDYVLSSPNNVSKDGFFLFAVPTSGGTTDWTLKVESVRVYDIDGNPYDAVIQNADGAFVKIHQSWWRYALPCERVNINNEDTNAITTGKYKVQSLEFADVAMAEILKNVDNCNLVFRTQQGNGYIKTLSINLNSLTAKADLLFNFVGRWYYLKGTALGASFNITINGEQVTINVSNNTFIHRYKEAITALTFDGADVVSVDFSDCDNLDNLTSCDNMFKNCGELIAVDFAGKKMSAVLSANDMFDGCANLTTLICPDSSTWKADLDFSDCPNLTTDSLYDLIKYLYVYESGTHTITPNTTMWQSLDGAIQDDIIAKAAERGWTIAIPAQYSVTGTSSASTVYATINGNAIEIDVVGGNWSYDYNTPISSISFEGDANVQTIDFSLSDGLANVTSLDNAFKDCTMLTSVDFTNCDISNVVSASDCFANCGSLFNVTIPSNSWKSDVDFSSCLLITYAEMQDIINSLYTYTSGTHTITWNTTYWDSLTPPQQQTISDAADAKGWTTNAVAVVYYIRGTSSNVNGTETFSMVFIDDGAVNPNAREDVVVQVGADGKWEFSYYGKKLYNISQFTKSSNASNNTTLTSIDFSDAEGGEIVSAGGSFGGAFAKCDVLASVDLSGLTFAKCKQMADMFYLTPLLRTIIWANDLNLDNLESVGTVYHGMFQQSGYNGTLDWSSQTLPKLSNIINFFYQSAISAIDLRSAKFDKIVNNATIAFAQMTNATSVNLSSATFENMTDFGCMFWASSALQTITIDKDKLNLNKVKTSTHSGVGRGFFNGCSSLTSVDFLSKQAFPELTINYLMFNGCSSLTSVDLSSATFAKVTDAQQMFNGCPSLTSVDLSSATFALLTNGDRMFYGCTNLTTISWSNNLNLSNLQYMSAASGNLGMFYNCQALNDASVAIFATQNLSNVTRAINAFTNCKAITSISFGNNTFASLTSASGMFNGCTALASVDLSSATFASCTNIESMFNGCTALASVDLSSATFASVTSASNTFRNCNHLTSLDLSSATFISLTNMGSTFNGCTALVSIDMSSADCGAVTESRQAFQNCNALTTFDVPQNSTAMSPTSAVTAVLAFSQSPLIYASMLKIANWIGDMTNYSAHNLTFKSSAWNSLSAAEQANIQGILQAKNWNLSI